MAQKFHISDVLSITTGLLVSTRHIDGVYEILNFMCRDNLFTHQLPRASEECKPWLFRQHPWLKEIDGATLVLTDTPESAAYDLAKERVDAMRHEGWQNIDGAFQPSSAWPDALKALDEAREANNAAATRQIALWLQPLIDRYGEWVEVKPIPADDHARRHPLTELEAMVGKDKVLVIPVDESEQTP